MALQFTQTVMQRIPIQWIAGVNNQLSSVVLALCLLQCSEKTAIVTTSPAQPVETPSQRGLRNATTMIENAEICELRSDVVACQRACELNHSNSCANWGLLLQRDIPKKALVLFARGCKGGSGIGCEAQARASIGKEQWRLFREARRSHGIHCEQGYTRSCEHLAVLLAKGLGGPVDPATSAVFLQKAQIQRHKK